MTTVRDTLALSTLSGCYVAGGAAGLGRTVSSVNVMSVPDIEDYLAPGDLLLTTAYPVLGRADTLPEFVAALARRGVAAVGFKPRRYLGEVPADFVAACNAWSLPLVILPDDASFNVILAEVLGVLQGGNAAVDAGTIERRLTQAAIGGGGLVAMAHSLSLSLKRGVRILDAGGAVLAEAAGADRGAWREGMTQAWPVRISGAERGRVEVAGLEEITPTQAKLVELASFAIAMHMAQERAHLELQRRQLVLYLEELVAGVVDHQVLRERFALFGWPTGPYVVLLASSAHELADAAVVAAAAAALPPGSLAWARGSEAVAIVPDGARGLSAEDLEIWRADLGADAVVGAGSVVGDADGLASSHGHAREAMRLARAGGLSSARFADLSLERLIMSVPPAVLEAFVAAELGPLLAADRRGADLCRTLHRYLRTGNAAQAARELFIHYNTMKARLGRIRSLLGDRIDSPRGRVALLLALEARTVQDL